ncbi:hypothetical protein C5167_011062 [Papaver somniferum]|uniref:Uncharacterized protein n=1 Tax=Papaver somniferum TaxID=3469 RepID=A0A4Y7K638_PAPSO|nr:hypothetical protein C5167_011062 [Papaver somniferum]
MERGLETGENMKERVEEEEEEQICRICHSPDDAEDGANVAIAPAPGNEKHLGVLPLVYGWWLDVCSITMLGKSSLTGYTSHFGRKDSSRPGDIGGAGQCASGKLYFCTLCCVVGRSGVDNRIPTTRTCTAQFHF